MIKVRTTGGIFTMADPRPELRELLLHTAARLFRTRGYAAVSLRTIAAEAGVTTGSLYYYFNHKDQIVKEILDTGHKQVHAEVKRCIAALGPRATRAEKVVVGVRAHLAALFEMDSYPAANVRIFAHVPANIRSAVRPGRRAYEEYWIDLLGSRKGATKIDPRQLTMFLFGATNWTLEWYREKRDSLDGIANNLAVVMLGEDATTLARTEQKFERAVAAASSFPRSQATPCRRRVPT